MKLVFFFFLIGLHNFNGLSMQNWAGFGQTWSCLIIILLAIICSQFLFSIFLLYLIFAIRGRYNAFQNAGHHKCILLMKLLRI